MHPYRIAKSLEDIKNLNILINSAYRGDSSKLGWTTEADLLGGQRIDPDKIQELIEDSANKILIFENQDIRPEILGCVLISKKNENLYYLGMLTVKPQFQSRGLGTQLISAYEIEIAKTKKPDQIIKIEMTVIAQRIELIAWYKKKGFLVTDEKRPFPYGDSRFGLPKREDLYFVVMEKTIL